VAVEDVVVPFTGGARPDMTIHIAAWDQGWRGQLLGSTSCISRY
jgi:hypothetical protein